MGLLVSQRSIILSKKCPANEKMRKLQRIIDRHGIDVVLFREILPKGEAFVARANIKYSIVEIEQLIAFAWLQEAQNETSI